MPVYQNKKNGTWKYRVYAEDIYGQRKQFEKSGFATKREAQFAERERALTQCSGESEITFSQLWEEYKEYIELIKKYYLKIYEKYNWGYDFDSLISGLNNVHP